MLLKKKPFSEISIKEIADMAQVSRNSFYRNYNDKEDILLHHLRYLYTVWEQEFYSQTDGSNSELYRTLFTHIKENSEVYLLLQQRGLFHLFLNVLLEQAGAKPEYNNLHAYITSFVSYGTYGWIVEWLARGMQEPAEMMAAFLTAQNKHD